MTIPEAYAFLLAPRKTQAEIHKLIMRREALHGCLLPAGIRYDLDKVQTSPSDRMSAIEAEIVDTSREIDKLMAQKLDQIEMIADAIALLRNDTEQIILTGYYLSGLSMRQISETIHYTVRGANKIRQRAIRHLAESVPEVPAHM